MFIKDLKSKMLLPKREVFINKTVKIQGNNVHLISLTVEENRNTLWILYEEPSDISEEIDIEERIRPVTNRDRMLESINRQGNFHHIHISELIIQNQRMTFETSTANRLGYTNYEGYMQLQHFIEQGLNTTNWNEVNIQNLVIAAYVQNENEEFPSVDLSKNLDITLKTWKDSKQVLIDPPMEPIRVGFGESQKDCKFYFFDPISNRNRAFYINKIMQYDIWEEINKQLKGDWAKDLPEDQIEEMREGLFNSISEICPKGMNLALLEYESEDDIQLNFYAKEYLDEKIVYNTSSTGPTSSGSVGFIYKTDKELGAHGFKSRTCMLKPVEKDFNGSIEVELFSWYMEIPEETITID